jgi:serine/threonine protein kinase
MAPEQAIGYANESSDIYSLAKIVIEMLTSERLSTLLPDASIDLAMRVRELRAKLEAGLSAASIRSACQRTGIRSFAKAESGGRFWSANRRRFGGLNSLCVSTKNSDKVTEP